MATKRKKYVFRSGDIIDVEEYHDGRYGAPGMPRQKKKKVTKEQMIQINLLNKARKAKRKMLAYMNFGDYFATWTYAEEKRLLYEIFKKQCERYEKSIKREVMSFIGSVISKEELGEVGMFIWWLIEFQEQQAYLKKPGNMEGHILHLFVRVSFMTKISRN